MRWIVKANLISLLVVMEQSVKMHVISATAKRSLKSLFFVGELMECFDTGRAKRSKQHMLICMTICMTSPADYIAT
jgi:hypothetical protein